jgi:hypothetical protein
MALNDSIGRMLLATKIPYPNKATHELISESGTSTSPITTAIERKIVVARRISSAVKGKSSVYSIGDLNLTHAKNIQLVQTVPKRQMPK